MNKDNYHQYSQKVQSMDNKSLSERILNMNVQKNNSLSIPQIVHSSSNKNQSIQIFNSNPLEEVKDSLDKAKNAIDNLLLEKQNLQSQLDQYESHSSNLNVEDVVNIQRKSFITTGTASNTLQVPYFLSQKQIYAKNQEQDINHKMQTTNDRFSFKQNYEEIIIFENIQRQLNLSRDQLSQQQLSQYTQISNYSTNSNQVVNDVIDQQQHNQFKQKETEQNQNVMRNTISNLNSQVTILNMKVKQMEGNKNTKKSHKKSKSNKDNSSSSSSDYSSSNSSDSDSRSSSSITSSSGDSRSSSRSQRRKQHTQQNKIQRNSHIKYESKIQFNYQNPKKDQKDLIQNFFKNIRMNKSQFNCFRDVFKNESEFYSKIDSKQYKYLFFKMIDYHNNYISEIQENMSIPHHQNQQSINQKHEYYSNQNRLSKIQEYNINSQQSKLKIIDSNAVTPIISHINKNKHKSSIMSQYSNTYAELVNEMQANGLEGGFNQHIDSQNQFTNNQMQYQNKNFQKNSINASDDVLSSNRLSQDLQDFQSKEQEKQQGKKIKSIKNQLKTMTSPSGKGQTHQQSRKLNNNYQQIDEFHLNGKVQEQNYVNNQSQSNRNNSLRQAVYNQNTDINNTYKERNNHYIEYDDNNYPENDKFHSERNKMKYNKNNNQKEQNNIQVINTYHQFVRSIPNDQGKNKKENFMTQEDEDGFEEEIIYQFNQNGQQQRQPQPKQSHNRMYEEKIINYQYPNQQNPDYPRRTTQQQQGFNPQNEDYPPYKQEKEHNEKEYRQRNQPRDVTPPQKKVNSHNNIPQNRPSISGKPKSSHPQDNKQRINKIPNDDNKRLNVPNLDLDKIDQQKQNYDTPKSTNLSDIIPKEKDRQRENEYKHKLKTSIDNFNTSESQITSYSQTKVTEPKIHDDHIYYVMPHLRKNYMKKVSLEKSEYNKLDKYKPNQETKESMNRKQSFQSQKNSKFFQAFEREKSATNDNIYFSERQQQRSASIPNEAKRQQQEYQNNIQSKQNTNSANTFNQNQF